MKPNHLEAERLTRLLANPDAREQFEFEIAERAAIREFDGGEERERAERLARAEVSKKWMREQAT